MMKFCRNTQIFSFSTVLLISTFVFTLVECKTFDSSPRSKSAQSIPTPNPVESRSGSSNVFISMAKSLANEALSQFQESARRNPRLGFNLTFLMPPNTNMTGNSTKPNFGNLLETTGQLGLIGLKGAVLGVKAAIVQTIVVILFIVFLLTGIAYFACNIGIISCSGLGNNLGVGGGEDPSYGIAGIGNPFSRNGYNFPVKLQRATSSVYNALDEGQKKFT